MEADPEVAPTVVRIFEVYPESAEGEGFRLEADMLLFASPLGRHPKDETPGEDPERLVRLVAGGRYARVSPPSR